MHSSGLSFDTKYTTIRILLNWRIVQRRTGILWCNIKYPTSRIYAVRATFRFVNTLVHALHVTFAFYTRGLVIGYPFTTIPCARIHCPILYSCSDKKRAGRASQYNSYRSLSLFLSLALFTTADGAVNNRQ